MPTFANTIDGNEILAKRSQCDYAGNDIQTTYATKSEVTTGLSTKQDTISDLATIRSGAADGATAVQPGDLATVATTGAYSDLSGAPTIPPALSAGNGIDITNNVVSADLDGTSLTNGANGLSVTLPVPDTTGASQGDVLSVGQNGIEWTTLALTSGNVYKATSTDTYATLYQAFMVDHKLVYYGEGYPLILKNLMSDNSSNVSGHVYFQTSFMYASKKVVILYDDKRLAEGAQLGSLTSYAQEIIPASSSSHIGQFITPLSNGVMGWATINQVPASTSADADKVLTVDSQGTPAWSTPAAGSVTDVEVDGTSVVSGGVASITMPTILPYKPVVAGTGVRIVDDTANNRIVVEADETVLYQAATDEGTTLQLDQYVTLSESMTHFERVRIYYAVQKAWTGKGVFESYMVDGDLKVNLHDVWYREQSGFNVWYETFTYNKYTDSNLRFTQAGGVQRAILNTTWNTTSGLTTIVYKIVGVHRIASN